MTHRSKLSKQWSRLVKFCKEVRELFWGDLGDGKYRMVIEKDLKKQIKPTLKFAALTAAVAGAFFLLWGGLAPLDSAAIARGHLVLSGNRKVIQHHDGGRITEILVQDGTEVKVGQPLIILDDITAKADYKISLGTLENLLVNEKRILAEEKNADTIDFSDPLLDPDSPDVQRLIQNQEKLFYNKRKLLASKKEAYTLELNQWQIKVPSLRVQVKSLMKVYDNAKAKLADIERLYNEGHLSRHAYMEGQREYENCEMQLSHARSELATAQQKVKQAEISIMDIDNEYYRAAEEEYRQNHTPLLEWTQRYLRAKEVLEKTTIRAPVDGIITGLQYHTVGGIIPPGYRIMEIIPQSDELIVEAYVPLQEVASIKVGTEAKIQFPAYKQRLVPRIKGEVIYVSADSMSNDRGTPPSPFPGQYDYYVVKVKIDEKDLSRVNYDVKLYPGMDATVFLIRGSRTFLQYLLSPIIDSFHHAFKEA